MQILIISKTNLQQMKKIKLKHRKKNCNGNLKILSRSHVLFHFSISTVICMFDPILFSKRSSRCFCEHYSTSEEFAESDDKLVFLFPMIFPPVLKMLTLLGLET